MSGLGDMTAFPTLGDDFMDTPDRGRMPKSAYGMDGKPGMTYRQWVAGLCAAGQLSHPAYDSQPAEVARHAVACADALIAALEGPAAQDRAGEPETFAVGAMEPMSLDELAVKFDALKAGESLAILVTRRDDGKAHVVWGTARPSPPPDSSGESAANSETKPQK